MQFKNVSLLALLAGSAAAQCSNKAANSASASEALSTAVYSSFCQSISAGSTTSTVTSTATLTVTSGVTPTPTTTSMTPAATPDYLNGFGFPKQRSLCSCLNLGTTTFTYFVNAYASTTTLNTATTTSTTSSTTSTTTSTTTSSTTSTTTSTTSTTTSSTPSATPTCAGTSGPNGSTFDGYTLYCAQQVGGYATLYTVAGTSAGVDSCTPACDSYNANPSQPGRSCVAVLYHIPQNQCELLYYVASNSFSPRVDTDLAVKNSS